MDNQTRGGDGLGGVAFRVLRIHAIGLRHLIEIKEMSVLYGQSVGGMW